MAAFALNLAFLDLVLGKSMVAAQSAGGLAIRSDTFFGFSPQPLVIVGESQHYVSCQLILHPLRESANFLCALAPKL